jgi:hypothetical protein
MYSIITIIPDVINYCYFRGMKIAALWLFITALCLTTTIFAQTIELLDSNTFQLGEGVVLSKTSFRGLCVVNDKVIWASGSRGTFARSTDGGKTFAFTQIKGYEKSDFRDIEAFDDKRAIMMSIATPACILKTIDGGQTWKEVYRNMDSAYFLDAMDFWNERKGVIVGDPINGKFVILETNDSGNTWKQESEPPVALTGEAVYAASGTSLKCLKENSFAFVTGGSHSRIIRMEERSSLHCWSYDTLPIAQGKSSSGAFSFDVDKKFAIAVGGDYVDDTLVTVNSCAAKDYTKKWSKPSDAIYDFNGYRSGVALVNKDILIACGSSGVDMNKAICAGGGRLQAVRNISKEGFHVVKKAKKGKAVFLAGPKGKIAKLIY